MPWWSPQIHADRRPALIARGRIKAAMRAWFEGQGFTEVECGALVVSPGNEAHLHAFATELIETGGARAHALSPHLAGIRRQEAAGRGRDAHLRFRPRLPQPRARAAACARIHHAGMVSRERGLRARDRGQPGAAAPGRGRRRAPRRLRYRDRVCDPRAEAERLTVAEAFTHHAGIDLLATLDAKGEGDRDHLATQGPARRLRRRGGRQLVRHLHQGAGRARRAEARRRAADDPLSNIPRCEAALARASRARSARRRTLRALCLRRRTRQRLRRAHRRGRTARPLRGGDGREAARLRRALSHRRGFPGRAGAHAAGVAAWRSASTGW